MSEPVPSLPVPAPPASTDPLAERVVASEVVHRGRYMEFRVDTIERADGTRGRRDGVGHPGAVAVLALDDQDRVLMVRQWRVPAGRALLEIPAGTLDVHEGVTEDPDLAARRELEEETGHRAASWRTRSSSSGSAGEWIRLTPQGPFAPSAAVSSSSPASTPR